MAMTTLNLFWLPALVSGLIAFFISPLVIAFYRRHHWLDDPAAQKHQKVTHTYPVPRGGGLVIGFSLLLTMTLFLGFDKHSLGIMAGILILTLVGFLDDLRDLSPYWRLFWGLIASLCVVAVGIGIAFITNPLGGSVIHLSTPQIPIFLFGKLRTIWVLSDTFAFLWLIWCMNMVNWSKGLDGQLPGTVAIAATIIALLSLRYTEDVTQWAVSILAAITAGAYLGFLPWNRYPQRMMPGYGGGSLAGFLLGILSILSGAKLATLIIVLGIPMTDAAYVIIRRLRHHRSPVWGDRSHLHHTLLSLGWSKSRIALFYWAMTLILGLVALQLNPKQKMFTILVITLVFGAAVLWLNYFTSSSSHRGLGNGLKT